MRLTLNAELAKRGHHAMLLSGDGYFYFRRRSSGLGWTTP